MDKELKAKWVKALRSGEYKQGANFLFFEGAYCCWGVLRHIANPNDNRSGGNNRFLSDEQIKEYGFDRHYDTSRLERMNDGVGMFQHSFVEIADYIEKNL